MLSAFWSCSCSSMHQSQASEKKDSPRAINIDYPEPLRYSDNTTPINITKYRENNIYVIRDVIDLKGQKWVLPPNITIRLDGGIVKNGTVVGNNTKLIYKGVVFDHVLIKGTWNVPVIKTSMFTDLSYDNSLRDVFSLSNAEIYNEIYIGKGTYYVTALEQSDCCININSNSEVVIDGDIILTPNDFTNYKILLLKGNNITLRGRGNIIGDKFTHKGSSGEWGMGIYISGGNNIKLNNIIIKECWGDCIYITKGADNVLIDGCLLDHGRRQGISIISAGSVKIKNCTISNVGGTRPQYAIDIEPNAEDTVKYVLIDNVKSYNCLGGFKSTSTAKNSLVRSIIIKNSTVEKTVLYPMSFRKIDYVSVENSKILDYTNSKAIRCLYVDSLLLRRNTINKTNKGKSLKILDIIDSPIEIKHVRTKECID